RMKRKRILSAVTKERLRQSALKSWRSGTRRRRRTKKEIAADQKILLDQEYKRALEAQHERTRIANRARYEQEDAEARRRSAEETQRLADQAYNERLIAAMKARGYSWPKLPAGVKSIGHGRLDVRAFTDRRPSVQIMP